SLTHDAFRFGVAFLADIENLIAACREIKHEVMCFGHIRAGRVDDMQAALEGALLDAGRDPMRGEDDGSLSYLIENRHSVRPIKGEDAKPVEFLYSKPIVNDEANDIYRTRQ